MAEVTDREAYEFVMSFVAASDRYKDQFLGKWEEVIRNFMVEPHNISDMYDSPYARGTVYRSKQKNIVLKDPETHRVVMTYAAKLIRSMFGDQRHEYVQAYPVGYEDAVKAKTVTRLLRYGFSRPGFFRTMTETIVDMLLFGTSVVETPWEYDEREISVRTVEQEYGIETSNSQMLVMPVYDDVKPRLIDISRFYPDPSRYRIEDMSGAAKEFEMTASESRAMAARGAYSSRGVEVAIKNGTTADKPRKSNFRLGVDQPDPNYVAGFGTMIGYEYHGHVDSSKGWRTITILNGVVVRNKPYIYSDPYLPFTAFTINPVQGRFYGISPAEIVRWDQSFADAVKILLAEAIIRQVHPPIAYDPDSEIDPAQIKRWKADTLIPARGGPRAVGTLTYDANVQAGFGMLQGLKTSIQETSGALGAISGDPGPSRESATGAAQRVQMAMDRPELAGMLIENDPLPCMAAAYLRRYQQFLPDTEALLLRVGEMPESVWIGDIMGDYDVMFLGSRLSDNKQAKLQAFDRLVSYSNSVPAFQAVAPTVDLAKYVVGDLLELPELVAKVADPQQMLLNMLAMQGAGGKGAGNNQIPTSSEPPGIAPAQASGNIPG